MARALLYRKVNARVKPGETASLPTHISQSGLPRVPRSLKDGKKPGSCPPNTGARLMKRRLQCLFASEWNGFSYVMQLSRAGYIAGSFLPGGVSYATGSSIQCSPHSRPFLSAQNAR